MAKFTWILAIVVTIALPVLPINAEAPFSLAQTPGRLPKDILPENYRITLIPDLKTLSFTGSETITLQVTKPRNTIIFNTLELNITAANLNNQTPQIKTDQQEQLTTLTFAQPLAPGTYELNLNFQGVINAQSQGLFYSKYLTTAGEKIMLATQMEPTDARRMFPSWDEPVFRAKYQLTTIVPKSWLAVSNTPIQREQATEDGRKRVTFEPTPKMSSYLVVLAAGELETLDGESEGVQIRIVTPKGRKQLGTYALDASQKLLTYFTDYFGVKYPLPKLDMIAVPGGFASFGAMENWGGITYSESILLFDPQKSSQNTREDIFGVIAHEIAHQWFGNLVTMAWWDNLWLNEGFASWMGTKSTNHFNPDWNLWLRANSEKETAMTIDARRTTHPIQQKIDSEAQANQAFDEITYLKGQSFLRMLEQYLGEDTFRAGIRLYMQKHQFSNTTTADLWAALGEVSGKPVQQFAAAWVEQPGFPVVKAQVTCRAGKQQVRLEQERFTVNYPGATALQWQIPVALPGASYKLLTGTSATTQTSAPCEQPLKLNANNVGYYRIQYERDEFQKLTKNIRKLPVSDQVNLLSDTYALVTAGRVPVTDYLSLVNGLKTSTSAVIWEQIAGTLTQLDALQQGQRGQAQFRAYGRKLLNPLLTQVGWQPSPQDSANKILLRGTVVELLGKLGDPEVIKEARLRYQRFRQDPTSLDGNLRPVVLSIVGRYGDQATYDQLREAARQATSSEEQRLYQNAYTANLDPKIAAQTLAMTLTSEVAPPRIPSVVTGVARVQTDLAWDFARTHLTTLLEKLPFFGRSNFVPRIFNNFKDARRAEELLTFARTNLPIGDQPDLQEAAETIRFNAALKTRLLPPLDRWVKGQS